MMVLSARSLSSDRTLTDGTEAGDGLGVNGKEDEWVNSMFGFGMAPS